MDLKSIGHGGMSVKFKLYFSKYVVTFICLLYFDESFDMFDYRVNP